MKQFLTGEFESITMHLSGSKSYFDSRRKLKVRLVLFGCTMLVIKSWIGLWRISKDLYRKVPQCKSCIMIHTVQTERNHREKWRRKIWFINPDREKSHKIIQITKKQLMSQQTKNKLDHIKSLASFLFFITDIFEKY
jgi:hypothetical protein